VFTPSKSARAPEARGENERQRRVVLLAPAAARTHVLQQTPWNQIDIGAMEWIAPQSAPLARRTSLAHSGRHREIRDRTNASHRARFLQHLFTGQCALRSLVEGARFSCDNFVRNDRQANSGSCKRTRIAQIAPLIRAGYNPSLLFSTSLTACGLAFPPVCFITWPTNQPSRFGLAFTCSTLSALPAMMASIAASIAPTSVT